MKTSSTSSASHEIAEAVAYLVSHRAGFIVGANLVIDGDELPRT
jgi:NAD(P)-dependent dehydrogenase (short-subunit alcohol dehydrogenase family)